MRQQLDNAEAPVEGNFNVEGLVARGHFGNPPVRGSRYASYRDTRNFV